MTSFLCSRATYRPIFSRVRLPHPLCDEASEATRIDVLRERQPAARRRRAERCKAAHDKQLRSDGHPMGLGPQAQRSFPHFLRKKWGRRRHTQRMIIAHCKSNRNRFHLQWAIRFKWSCLRRGTFDCAKVPKAHRAAARTPLSARHFATAYCALS